VNRVADAFFNCAAIRLLAVAPSYCNSKRHRFPTVMLLRIMDWRGY